VPAAGGSSSGAAGSSAAVKNITSNANKAGGSCDSTSGERERGAHACHLS
jgi:hypothetical protein